MASLILNTPHLGRDVLDDALLALRLVDSRLCQSLMRAPWGLSVPAGHRQSAFVAVASGTCQLRLGGETASLQGGDFVLLPHCDAHELSDAGGTPPMDPSALRWDSVQDRCVIDAGGDGPLTHVLTGVLVFEASPLVDALPPALRIPHDDTLGGQGALADLLWQEARRPGPGAEVVLTHLAVLLAIASIRRWLLQDRASNTFLRALHTPAIRRVLGTVHSDPRRVWSLDELARIAGMSRSAFSQQFAEILGYPPMRYWTHWRMSVARDWLLDRKYNVDEAADALGYGSRAAFSRAYKAHMGEPPGQTRRSGRTPLRTLNDRMVEAGGAEGVRA